MSLLSFLHRHYDAPPVEDSIDIAARATVEEVHAEAVVERRRGLAETRAIRERISGQWDEAWDRMHFAQERLIENDIARTFDQAFNIKTQGDEHDDHG